MGADAIPISQIEERRFSVFLAAFGAILLLFALLLTFLYPLTGLYNEIVPNAIKTKPAWGMIDRGVITIDKTLYVVAIAAVHLVYLGAFIVALRRGRRSQVVQEADEKRARVVLAFGIACAVILLLSYPLFSQDVYDYLFHTHEWVRYGASPFTHVPSQFRSDPLFAHVSWTEAPSPYGPVWLLLTAPLSLLAGSNLLLNLILFKGLAVACYAGSAYLVYVMLGKYLPRYRLAGTILFAWSPMVLMEFGGSGHNDIVMIFFAMLALWLVLSGRFALALVALTLSLLIKIITVFIFPLFLIYIWKKLSERKAHAGESVSSAMLGRSTAGFRFAAPMPRDIGGAAILPYILLCLAVAFLAYAPIWEGTNSMAFLRRGDIIGGAPVGNVATDLMATLLGHDLAAQVWKLVAWGSFGLLILRQCWVVWHRLAHVATQLPILRQLNKAVVWLVYGRQANLEGSQARPAGAGVLKSIGDETSLELLARTSMSLLFFYAVVVSQYYQPWYLSWAFMWAGFLQRPKYATTLWTLLIFGVVAVVGYMYL